MVGKYGVGAWTWHNPFFDAARDGPRKSGSNKGNNKATHA